MMIKNTGNQRNQIQFVSADSLVPEDHLLRDIDRAIDFSFIYELVQDKYSQDHGRPIVYRELCPACLVCIDCINAKEFNSFIYQVLCHFD